MHVMPSQVSSHNNHFTAHVLAYKRNKNGVYSFLVGQKTIISYHKLSFLLIDQKRYKQYLKDKVANASLPLAGFDYLLGKAFHSAGGGKYVTPGGQPKTTCIEDPVDTATREWIEEILYQLLGDPQLCRQAYPIIKSILVPLCRWNGKYDIRKYGILFALDIDLLCEKMPDLSIIKSNYLLEMFNKRNLIIDHYYLQWINNLRIIPEKVMLPFALDDLPEFEKLFWLNQKQLKHLSSIMDPCVSTINYMWVKKLFLVYAECYANHFTTLGITSAEALAQRLLNYISHYDNSFIRQGINIILQFQNSVLIPQIMRLPISHSLSKQNRRARINSAPILNARPLFFSQNPNIQPQKPTNDSVAKTTHNGDKSADIYEDHDYRVFCQLL